MERISVRVKTGKSKEDFIRREDGSYEAHIKSAPVDGKANKDLIKLIAKRMGIPKSAVSILSGHTSKTKIIGINV